MARIESDPNYTAPTFSRATAATDLFKKEDVQGLAAAVSIHTHNGTGTGLAIVPAAGSIPGSALADGSVTSAKIADLTITEGDLANGAVSTAKIATDAVTATTYSQPASGGGTTSTTLVDIGVPFSVTFISYGGAVEIKGSLPLVHDTATGLGIIGGVLTDITIGGADSPLSIAQVTFPSAGSYHQVVWSIWYAAGTFVSGHSYKWRLQWRTTAGTLSTVGTIYGWVIAEERKR